ncbi:growth hormone secretagogue receptor type 1-like [Paralichthys olivaceus]|uniref:growth hormone secretagogue receptor type 1-like n=1 Tax=Paralichthys olivaceus TaxID=8255 RepID=UPI003752AE00
MADGNASDADTNSSMLSSQLFYVLVCVSVIYVSLMLFGVLGNTLTILVVWLRPHMRSSTYLYLSSMAVSDLLILLLLPLDLYTLWNQWPLGDLVCKLTIFLVECCTFCTILHITFLSLERYLAVCWPITAKTLVTRCRTSALIGCLWLGAAVSAAPLLVMVGEDQFKECLITDSAFASGLLLAMIILSSLYVLVPMCILGLVHSLIGRTLWLRPQSRLKDQSRRRTVKILGVIVLAFILCWLPLQICRITMYGFLNVDAGRQETHTNATTSQDTLSLTPSTPDTHTYIVTPSNITHNNTHTDTHADTDSLSTNIFYMYLVSSVLFYLSAAINPLLYNLMSHRYRHAVRSLVHTHCHTPPHRLRTTLASQHPTANL